ncbi:MAG: alkaline phosphatase family protein [Bacteroidetes bacterium]|nr:alkaline phosphatase family protein [Bacteroidota bacterium]
MRIILFFLATLFLFSNSIAAQKKKAPSKYIAGPMLGYVQHREACVWLLVDRRAEKAIIRYWKPGAKDTSTVVCIVNQQPAFFNPYRTTISVKFILPLLDMNTTYNYKLNIDKETVTGVYSLTTKDLWEWRKPAPDFSFIVASCFYLNDSIYDRPGRPYGVESAIFDHIAEQPADFMIWTGDNIYLREVDYSSNSGMEYRYIHARKHPLMKKIFYARPNYAIWDDHDFGPNDANREFPLKEASLELFKDFWGNQTYGEADNKGVYSKFSYADADFFLVDNRYYRTPEKNKLATTQLGKEQLNWLKNNIASSTSKFKFIIAGGQMLDTIGMAKKECLGMYENDYNEFINFISEKNIKGLVFISGDRHLTELLKIKTFTGKSFYEFTCSPVSSGAYNIKGGPELNKPGRIENTLVSDQNYGKISVYSNADKKRVVKIEVFDKENAKRWTYEILESQLNGE